jgi:hypothetical protein
MVIFLPFTKDPSTWANAGERYAPVESATKAIRKNTTERFIPNLLRRPLQFNDGWNQGDRCRRSLHRPCVIVRGIQMEFVNVGEMATGRKTPAA